MEGQPDSGVGSREPGVMLKVGYGFAMATQFGASVLGGLWLGGWIGRRYSIEPWGTLGGAIAGMSAGIHGLIVLVHSMRGRDVRRGGEGEGER